MSTKKIEPKTPKTNYEIKFKENKLEIKTVNNISKKEFLEKKSPKNKNFTEKNNSKVLIEDKKTITIDLNTPKKYKLKEDNFITNLRLTTIDLKKSSSFFKQKNEKINQTLQTLDSVN